MGKKVLIVDDSRTFRQQLTFILKRGGYDPVDAEDGLLGIERLHQNPDTILIITDVNMPNLGGFEMVDKLNQEGNTVPIMMLTTEVAEEFLVRAKNAGVKAWMVKPFKADQLLAAVGKITG